MFNRKTVIVVGAGASCELGFPSGITLKGTIANALSFKFDRRLGRVGSGDERILESFSFAQVGQERVDWLKHARRVSAGMAIAPSIDNYLHTHAENRFFARCGKMAIARAILDAERASPLWHADSQHVSIGDSRIQSTWLPRFAWQLVVDVAKVNVERIFQNISFVIFNYDRCVEAFLYEALQAYYDIPGTQAAAILNRVTFYHPYGTVGRLPWQAGDRKVAEFAAEGNYGDLIELSDCIKTFTETVDQDDHLLAAQSAYNAASQVLFLGFSFGRQNMQLLRSDLPLEDYTRKRVLGTAYGVSEEDRDVFRARINASLARGLLDVSLHDLTCAALFDRYSQSIAGEV